MLVQPTILKIEFKDTIKAEVHLLKQEFLGCCSISKHIKLEAKPIKVNFLLNL
jgi:hypothetical protein